MYDPAKILPQKPPMILLSRVVKYDPERKILISEFDISEESIFFDHETRSVPSYLGPEYITQTAGCMLGIENSPEIELILGIRNFEVFTENFRENSVYRVSAEKQFSLGQMSSFYGEIFDDKNTLCARGEVNVYHSNTNEFREK
jgi:predicted hotdog family 3-hydroxylacyl-ACP dehydratase